MTEFRFLHTADIHLDSPLRGLAGHDGQTAEKIRTAPRAAFERLIAKAIDERIDFMVIAGDLYDGTWRDYRTGLFFSEQMGRLNQAGIPVYLAHGNHDAENRITGRLVLPDNVRTFGHGKPETFRADTLKVALHGWSFPQRDVTENPVPGYPPPVEGMFNIGILHTGLGGRSGHANYAPCTVGELVAKGYDYWALGHVHQREILHERPHVVFPGNLQGRHVRETGPKGAYLVSVRDNDIAAMTEVPVDVMRWEVLPVDATGTETVPEVVDAIRKALEAEAGNVGDRLLACRIRLHGRTALHDRLTTDDGRLAAEARSVALALGEEVAWVEKVVVATEQPAGPAEPTIPEETFGELMRMLEDAGKDAELLVDIERDFAGLRNGLPHEVRSEADDTVLQAVVDGNAAELIRRVEPFLAARLAEGENP